VNGEEGDWAGILTWAVKKPSHFQVHFPSSWQAQSTTSCTKPLTKKVMQVPAGRGRHQGRSVGEGVYVWERHLTHPLLFLSHRVSSYLMPSWPHSPSGAFHACDAWGP
jgi:hypothetical protein